MRAIGKLKTTNFPTALTLATLPMIPSAGVTIRFVFVVVVVPVGGTAVLTLASLAMAGGAGLGVIVGDALVGLTATAVGSLSSIPAMGLNTALESFFQ